MGASPTGAMGSEGQISQTAERMLASPMLQHGGLEGPPSSGAMWQKLCLTEGDVSGGRAFTPPPQAKLGKTGAKGSPSLPVCSAVVAKVLLRPTQC